MRIVKLALWWVAVLATAIPFAGYIFLFVVTMVGNVDGASPVLAVPFIVAFGLPLAALWHWRPWQSKASES